MEDDNTQQFLTRRLFAAEGSVHLYSTEPAVLTPAGLYDVREDIELRKKLAACNIYLIVSRKRIVIVPSSVCVDGNIVRGVFRVHSDGAPKEAPFEWQVPDSMLGSSEQLNAQVQYCGTSLLLTRGELATQVAAHVVVAQAVSSLCANDRDLEVLYVGQGIGRTKSLSAVDRLLHHSTLQRILSDTISLNPFLEILLLLYRFQDQRTIISTGGDLTAEPAASNADEKRHMQRMRDLKLTRHAQIALAEATLIKYFQPCFNIQLKGSEFDARRKIKILRHLLEQDITGIIVEICTANIGARLGTVDAAPLNLADLFPPDVLRGKYLTSESDKRAWAAQLQTMAHTHCANYPLTTADERDTFLHGTLWNGAKQRAELFPRK